MMRLFHTELLHRHKTSSICCNHRRRKAIHSLLCLSLAFVLTACSPSFAHNVSTVTPVTSPVHTTLNMNSDSSMNSNDGMISNNSLNGDIKNNDPAKAASVATLAASPSEQSDEKTAIGTEVPILTYHHILTTTEKNTDPRWRYNDMVVTVDQFAEEMKYLYDHDYHVITLSQLESFITGKETVPTHSVVITFDDGYESNFHYAAPILRQYHFRATIFAIVKAIKDSPQPWTASKLLFISWPEIKEYADVFSVESHTYNMHYERKGKAAIRFLPADQVLDDLTKSKNMLQASYFAYPYGSYDTRAIQLLKKAGYQMAVTTKKGYVKFGTPLFEVPRIEIVPGLTLQGFQSIVSDSYPIQKSKPTAPSLTFTHLAKMKDMIR